MMEWISINKEQKMIYLAIACIFEICFSIGLKYSNGFTQLIPSILTFFFMTVGPFILSLALKELPLGITYAIWTGVGMVGTTILSCILFNEVFNPLKIFFIFLILCGLIGLKMCCL